jgi:hypothetical protein
VLGPSSCQQDTARNFNRSDYTLSHFFSELFDPGKALTLPPTGTSGTKSVCLEDFVRQGIVTQT